MNFKYFRISALVPFILILGLILQPVSDWIEDSLKVYPRLSTIVDYIDTLSTLGMITLFLAFMNVWGWRLQIFKWLVDLPNLNGRYIGRLTSSYVDPSTGRNVEKDCVLEVKQSASGIHIHAYYGDLATQTLSSASFTTSEQIIKESNGFFTVYYIFTNEPETLSVQLNNHDGTSKFKYFPDTQVLDGEYYNRRGNTGKINVRFVQKKLLGRLIP